MKISRRHLETGGSSEVSFFAKTVGSANLLSVGGSTACQRHWHACRPLHLVALSYMPISMTRRREAAG